MRDTLHLPRSPQQIDEESRIVSSAVGQSTAVFLKSLDLISESYLAQALIALWDNGVYEYVRERGGIRADAAAEALGLDRQVLTLLLEYLAGRGLMKLDGDEFFLTDKGSAYWNFVTRGALTSHLGGYNALLTHLGPLLRNEISIEDERLDRSGRLVALGAAYTLLGTGMIPWVLEKVRELSGQFVLDLGCGAGAFLSHLALKWCEGGGVGIDMSPDAIQEARELAAACGVSDRVEFHVEQISERPMTMDRSILDRIDIVTAMFVLHEFGGRGGAPAITSVIRSLRRQFPGRKLLIVEGTRANPFEKKTGPVRSYAQLDYSFIHPLSRQGPLRTPDEWGAIIEDAGAKLLEVVPGFKLVPSWVNLYAAEM